MIRLGYRIEIIGPPKAIEAIVRDHFVGETPDFRTLVQPPDVVTTDLNAWASSHWGTPFMAAEGQILLRDSDRLIAYFEVLGGTAEPIFRAIARRYPIIVMLGYGIEMTPTKEGIAVAVAAVRGICACSTIEVDDEVARFMNGEPPKMVGT